MKIGKVYKIIHNQSNICYVGSTFNTLRDRFRKHCLSSGCKISDYFIQYGKENFKIILIKEYCVIDKEQLHAWEQLWINKLKSINAQCAFNPLYKNNKARCFKITCKCGSIINKEAKSVHEKTKRHLDNIKNGVQFEAIDPYKKYVCECGLTYTGHHKNRHMKSQKHLKLLHN